MPIIDSQKLAAALKMRDKDAIKSALSGLSTGELSKQEKGALYVSLFEAYLDAANSMNEDYIAFLKGTVERVQKINIAIGKAEDAQKIEDIKKSI